MEKTAPIFSKLVLSMAFVVFLKLGDNEFIFFKWSRNPYQI